MNRYLTLLLVGFLLFNQVLSRPNPEDKEQESDYPGDEEEESNDGDDDGPDVADIIIPSEVKMLSKDEDFKIKIGDDVRFPCRFTTGHAKADADDDVVYVWRRGKDQISLSDSLLISDSRFEIIEDHTLLLRNATVNDSSTSYVCELIASADFKPRVTHRLLVEPNELNYKVVPVPNSELHVNLHEPVKFGCKTDATSKTKITISHNGNKVHIQETDDGAYVNIKDVTRHHAGYYQCLVDFNAEKPITTAVHLIVNHPPEIELDQDHEITDKGPKVKLICKVHAQPHADVHWFKEDQKVESPDFIFGKEKPAKHTLTFDFDQDEKNFGKYSCQAINNLGSDKKDIVVSGKPSKPTFHHGEVVEDGKVLSLKWKTISFTELIKYEIQYRRKGDVQWQMLSIDKEVGNDVGHEYIIEGKINNLEADKYEAVCRAENKDGWSELSDVFEFKGEEKTERAENVIDPKNSSGRPVVFLSTILLTLTTLLFVITPFACL